MSDQSVGLTILGGLLAGGVAILIELWKRWRLRADQRSMIATVICDDLQEVKSVYEKLLDEWTRSKVIHFTTLGEFTASRQTYLKNSDWVAVLKDAELRREVVRYYQKSYEVITLLEQNERERLAINGRLNDLTRALQFQDAARTYEQARTLAISMMVPESRDLKLSDEVREATIQRVRDIRDQAAHLLTRLKGKP